MQNKLKLIHVADVHIGKRRLDGKLPHRDFADALAWIVRHTISEKADAMLIAGDLFDTPQIEPVHLRQAEECLHPLREAGIPVIAIEGNHDKTHLHSTQTSWLQYLAEDGLMHLLTTPFTSEGPVITPWDKDRRQGSFLDIGGVRFAGAGYLGAGTPRRVRAILEKFDDSMPLVLLLHAGPEYFVGESGGFSKPDLEYIRSKTTYLALGHIHKPMLYGNWACNPGSPENGDFGESAYSRKADGAPNPRGFACIEIDPESRPCSVSIAIHDNPRRPMFKASLDCTLLSSRARSGTEALIAAAKELLGSQQYPPSAAVELVLTGKMNLARIHFDTEQISTHLEKYLNLAAVSINFAGIGISEELHSGSASTKMESREELERKAILSLVQDEDMWGLSQREEMLADLFYALKEQVRQNRSPEEIAELLLNHVVIREVQDSLSVSKTPIAAEQ